MRKFLFGLIALSFLAVMVSAQNNSNPPVSTTTTAPKIASLPA